MQTETGEPGKPEIVYEYQTFLAVGENQNPSRAMDYCHNIVERFPCCNINLNGWDRRIYSKSDIQNSTFH